MQKVLYTPDPVRGVRRPGRELFRQSADVRPLAGAGKGRNLLAGGAESGKGGQRKERGNDNVAVVVEKVQEL